MSIVRFAMAIIAGTLVLLVLGFILYAMVFTGYFAANAEPGAAAVAKDPPEMVFIYLSELILAALLCLVIGCWAGCIRRVCGVQDRCGFRFPVEPGDQHDVLWHGELHESAGDVV